MSSRGDIKINDVQPVLCKNWQTLNFQEVLQKSGSFVKLTSKEYAIVGEYPVVDQGENLISGYINAKDLLYQGEIPVIIFGDHTRNLKYINFEFAVGADGTKILKPKPYLNELFFYYYLRVLKIPSLGYSRHYSILKSLSVPIPKLEEQKRIVAKLDEGFKHIEILKSKLEQIPVLLKQFKQTVLTHAVTGKLTEEWRKGKGLEEWKFEKAKDCCLKVQSGGTPKGSTFENEGVPFLKVYNIVNQNVDFHYRPQYVSDLIQNSQLKKSIAYPGDVLMNIVGPPLGKIAILPSEYPEWNINQAITLFRPNPYLLNTFLYYFFCEGSSVKSLINETRGVVGQVNISLSQCRDFDIPVPSKLEQEEIVRKITELFEFSDKVQSSFVSLKDKVDKLPQALLAKAFKGDLVSQDENEEVASFSLERISKLINITKK